MNGAGTSGASKKNPKSEDGTKYTSRVEKCYKAMARNNKSQENEFEMDEVFDPDEYNYDPTAIPAVGKLRMCPYDASHWVTDEKMVYHVTKCRRQYIKDKEKLGQPIEIQICRFDYTHHMSAKQLRWHYLTQHSRECTALKKQFPFIDLLSSPKESADTQTPETTPTPELVEVAQYENKYRTGYKLANTKSAIVRNSDDEEDEW